MLPSNEIISRGFGIDFREYTRFEVEVKPVSPGF